ncbi:DUF4468 domain-containing protein [Parabacteroides sp. PF5-6]|uniref:DUF4468 domain-containing protein n=1 Tax=Parabacteroides sp. PF5-6 TaxID=1742403 RepID=UPI0024055970|nr:DUF4468 domain-containing protein [Parabacteroides sp. PF5-6]MDF9830828.1 hypothetical protein [Parabacteroides sp. PF5-6]
MMKQLLLLGMLWIPSILIAQEEDERYLPGAVPVEEGKVVFTKEVTDPSLSQSQWYDKLLAWAESRFKEENNRVAYADKEKSEFAVTGTEKLIFASNALSLDTSEMSYHLVVQTKGNTATIQITHISYKYNVSYERETQRLVAEEVITDKYALTKKNKLNRINGKFRKATVDFVDQVFSEIDQLTGRQTPVITAVTPPPAVAPTVREIAETPLSIVQPAEAKEGYMAFEADKVPQAIRMMLPDSPMRITAGDTKAPVEKNATWKGLSTMFGKDVATISMQESSPVYRQIKDKFTIAFTKEDSQSPWMIIECNKQGETTDGTEKTLLGEILHIWIK